ncbi:Hypothetical protein R9X50_00614200 [Acrodontium crateriforme]|uniref:RanBD1 domain-containing protein n=1 Tax=Acrodontium crateriforme TaxID=150365 RepID=A0AAQ3M8J4_9PEZI|nr:Hypothetical protein R9X50_00614200 [Acrodontium crateriforme]
MSNKRGMEHQGGGDRYPSRSDENTDVRNGTADPPRQATAAQLANRKIASMKGRTSGRNSRQGSPATGAPPVTAFAQNQVFQPPQSTGGGFNFSFGQSPSFGQQPEQQESDQNGGNPFGGNQNNSTSIFSVGGAAPPRINSVSTFAAQRQAEMGLDSFGPKEDMLGSAQNDEITVGILNEFAHLEAIDRQNELLNAYPQKDTNGFAFQPSARPGSFLSSQKPQKDTNSIVFQQSAKPGSFLSPQKTAPRCKAVPQNIILLQQPVLPQQSAPTQQPVFTQQPCSIQQPVFTQQSAFQQQPVLSPQPVILQPSDGPCPLLPPLPNISTIIPDMTTPWYTPFANGEFTRQMQNGDSSHKWGQQTESTTSNTPTPSFSFGATQPQQSATIPPSSPFSFGATQTPQPAAAPSSSSFTFGTTQPQQPAQSTNSFSFGATQPQPTQPSASFSFGASQDTTKASTTSFGGFGQNTQSTQDTAKSSNPSFGGFGQQNGTNTPAFGGFGQNTQSTQDNARANTPTFGGFGQTTESTQDNARASTPSFGGFGNTTQSTQDNARASTPSFGGFGQNTQQNGSSTPLFFGASPAATPEPSTPGESVFSTVANKSNGIKPGMFTSQQNGQQTPKPASFSFGITNGAQAPSQPSAFSFGQSQTAQQTSSLNSVFGGGFGQANETPKIGFGAPKGDDHTMDKPEQSEAPAIETSSNGGKSLFDRMTARDPPAKTSAETEASSLAGKSLFGPMTPRDPPATEPRPSFASASSLFGAKAVDQTPSNPSKSLFEPPATAPKTATSLFPLNKESNVTPAPKSASSLFQTNKETDATPASKPATSLFQPSKNTEATPAPKPLFATPAPAKAAPSMAPQASLFAPATATKSKISTPATKPDTFKTLNEGLVAHLKGQDTTKDWTPIFAYYIAQATKLSTGNEPSSKPSVPAVSPLVGAQMTPKAPALSNMYKHAQTPAVSSSLRNQITQSPPATAPVSRKRSADDSVANDSDSCQPPATEKRARPNESVAYPKLPDSASNTARLFQSTLEKSTTDAPKFGPPAEVVAKVREDAAKKAGAETVGSSPFSFKPSSSFASSGAGPVGFKPTFGAPSSDAGNAFASFAQKAKAKEEEERKKRKDEDYDSDDDEAEWEAKDKAAQEEKARKIRDAAQKAPGFVFNPSSESNKQGSTATPAFTLKPATEDGLSAFAKKAKAIEEQERKKRKDEDYDSDDDEAEWEAKDKAAQEEKARKIREAAQQAPGFVFNPPAGVKSTTSIFAQTPQKSASTSSNLFSNKTPSSNIFSQIKTTDSEGSADKTEAEKEQGTGDHTWKPNTPIKFGSSMAGQGSTTPAAPPPANPFGGLFGSKTMTPGGATDKGKLGLTSKVGFNFGPATNSSLATSRATTPGFTTDGEASTAGDDESEEAADQAKETQIEDMTALLPEEKEGNEVVFEAEICKVSKFDEKKTEDGMVPAWIEKGRGPLYVLKNKATGSVRVLVKVPPLGRLAMNFTPIKDATYKVSNKKCVFGAFVDHLAKQSKVSSWTIMLREPKLAEELAQILLDGRSQ